VCARCWSNFNAWFILEFYITHILISTTSRFRCISRLIKVTNFITVKALNVVLGIVSRLFHSPPFVIICASRLINTLSVI
jgi:hypothetical protein